MKCKIQKVQMLLFYLEHMSFKKAKEPELQKTLVATSNGCWLKVQGTKLVFNTLRIVDDPMNFQEANESRYIIF